MLSPYHPLNFGLGETIDMLRDHVGAFAGQHIAPIADQIDKDNQFPNHLWPLLGDMGLLGITTSESFGGADIATWLMWLPWKRSAVRPPQLH